MQHLLKFAIAIGIGLACIGLYKTGNLAALLVIGLIAVVFIIRSNPFMQRMAFILVSLAIAYYLIPAVLNEQWERVLIILLVYLLLFWVIYGGDGYGGSSDFVEPLRGGNLGNYQGGYVAPGNYGGGAPATYQSPVDIEPPSSPQASPAQARTVSMQPGGTARQANPARTQLPSRKRLG